MEGTITQLGLSNYLINDKLQKHSFFQHSYKNYYNFAKDTRKIQFINQLEFGRDTTLKISEQARYGDLINNIILEIDLPNLTGLYTNTNQPVGYCNAIGYAMIKEVQLKIGGNIVDTQTGEWLYSWSQFSIPQGKRDVFNDNIKKFDTNLSANFKGGKVFIPLSFWFCQTVGANSKIPLVFPLIAMKNAEIELIIKIRPVSELIISDDNSSLTSNQLSSLNIINHYLIIDYIILTPEERLKYLNAKKQIYLINQIQEHRFSILTGQTSVNVNLRNFRYPISELMWVFRDNNRLTNKEYFNFTDADISNNNRQGFYETARLTFDGRDRIPELDREYFTNVEPLKVHDSVPFRAQISCYSFALEPENFGQPTGSCNFSGLHEPRMNFTMRGDITIPASELIIFAVNYNVLQIDEKGNVWLLHNLSKSSPDELPDLTKARYLDQCNLTIKEQKRAKEVIAEINKLNLFTDPRKIESGLLNIIDKAKRDEIISSRTRPDCINPDEGDFDSGFVQPYLSAITTELKRINQIISRNKQRDDKDIKFTDDTKKYADIGGMLIDMDNVDVFLKNLLSRSGIDKNYNK
jgi:hypothetical protein